MKSINPIYSFVLLLLFAVSVCSCSEDPGYSIQDTTDITSEEPIKSKETKVYKKAAPKKRNSGLKAGPNVRPAPTGNAYGPRVIPDRRGENIIP